jgi:hypothetical protein
MGSECVFANSDCDSFHGDRESRGHAKLVSGIGGFVAAGWFAVPWRWTPVGLVLGFAVDYGLYNGWRQFQFKKAYNLLEESLDSLILKMQSLNFQSASLKEKLLAEETLSKAMAEVFARMNIMEVAALSEAEVNYQIQLKLLDLLVDFELESESSLDGKITQLHSRLRQLKEQVQQSRDLWDVDIDDHALNSLLEFLSQRDCWLEDWSSREKDILSSDDSVLRSCPRRYGGGSRKAWWKQTLGRLVSAIDMDLFNSFRRELSRVRVLKEKLKQVTEKFKTRLKTAGHETLAYEIATSGVMVVSMLEARLATLDIEEHFLKQFIGANNSRPNNGKEVVDRLKRILSPLGPL